MKKTTALAHRLSQILARLNQGERLDLHQLADEFDVSIRTMQRDICQRLDFLEWEEKGGRYYKINQAKSGFLTEEDIERFARFASISDLFPNVDREFYQEKLVQSIQVKGFQYEDIRHRQTEFNQLNEAIKKNKIIHFKYSKIANQETKFYQVAPYSLVNKNGIWYLIGTDINADNKQKTFCFTLIDSLRITEETFIQNQQLVQQIQKNDSISHGNQLKEVVIQVNAEAAPYFLRRNLLPNQKLVHKLENGGLILACENVNEMEIIPLVQYWIPHLTIISPSEVQVKLVNKLNQYLSSSN